MFTESDFAAAKAILPCGVLRADDDDDLSALAHAFKEYRESLVDDLYPIFDILERLILDGHSTECINGVWVLLKHTDDDSTEVISGRSFRDLCVNIVLAGL